MSLTVGYNCDRNGVLYEHLIPDVLISKQNNFEDLLPDENVKEAIRFIRA